MNACTFFPDGSWSNCCARHDRRYANNRLTRRQADKLLFRCVWRVGKPTVVMDNIFATLVVSSMVVATVMYVGLRVFGWFWYWKAKIRRRVT